MFDLYNWGSQRNSNDETAHRNSPIAFSARGGPWPKQIRQEPPRGPVLAQTAPMQDSQTINITRSGSVPSRKGPAENFTGSVRVDPLVRGDRSSRHVWRQR